MRLTKQMKEILAHSLALRVEEMDEGPNKELVKHMLGTWQSQGIWGQEEEEEEEGWCWAEEEY
jgi:hypothetical protein